MVRKINVVFSDVDEFIEEIVRAWEKGSWRKESNRLVLESENYVMEVFGWEIVPKKALWILKNYRKAGGRVLSFMVKEGEEESIEEALGFLTLASVEPKGEDIIAQYSVVSGFSIL